MNIAKYDIPTGQNTSPSVGSTAVAGGTGTIDITPITEKLAALEAEVSNLKIQLSRANAALAGLDSKFLSKLGDTSDYSYYLGALYTDYIQSGMYGSGVGFLLSGNATGAVEDKYNFRIKDVGWGKVSWTTIQDSETTIVTSNTDEATASLNTSSYISIGSTIAAGYMLLDCGAQLTHERCFTEISKKVTYRMRVYSGSSSSYTQWYTADTDSNGYFIIRFPDADEVRVTIRFTYTYAFKKYGNVTQGSYRLYIQGTYPSDSQTDCFAAAIKTALMNSSGFTVIKGDNGTRITSDGLQTTTDGGATWS